MTGAPGDRVPSIPELRKTVQSSKTDRRLIYRVFRMVSIRITWLLLHTPISANQVTVLSLLVAIAGLVLLALPAPGVALLGCVLLFLYHVLDRVDGEVARFRRKFSLYGIYLDNLGHYLTGAGVFIAVAFRIGAVSTDPGPVWIVGSIAALVTMLVRIEKHASFQLFSQYVLDNPELLDTVESSPGALTRSAAESERAGSGARGAVALIRETLLTLSWFPITVLIVAAGLLLEVPMGSVDPSLIVLLALAGLNVLVWAGIELANLTQNLGSETRRLAHRIGLTDSPEED